MPLFGNQQNQATAVWEPKAADGRLAQTAGANPAGVFTSDLSVSEYVLLGEAGFEPLGFVVGSSIYHVGLQVGRWNQNTELQVLTQAMYNARELAMARMRAEADHLAADGIVGVQLRMQMYAWGQSCLEFVATGTAVPIVRHRRRQRGGGQSRLGGARDRVPGHRHRGPAARRGAPDAGDLPQADLHARPGQLAPGGRLRGGNLLCGGDQSDLFFPPVWSRIL